MKAITKHTGLAGCSIREINVFLDRLREMDGPNLVGCYRELFGHPPPRTRSREWMFYNCAYKYQEKHYRTKKIPEEVVRRAEQWYHKLTPEMEKAVALEKLKAAELKILCKTYNLTWDAKQRKKIVKDLAWLECGEQLDLSEGSGASSGVGSSRGKGKRGRRKQVDNLPTEIKELLAMKEGADKETQRKIRRKLRSIDPDWRSKV